MALSFLLKQGHLHVLRLQYTCLSQIFKSLRHSVIHNVVNIFKFASSCGLIASFAVLCDLERGRKNGGCCGSSSIGVKLRSCEETCLVGGVFFPSG